MRIRFVPPFLLLWVLLGSGRSLASGLALTNAKIYPAPTEPPIENAAILIHDGRIVSVGPSVSIKIPRDAQVIDCKGLVITAGFWNSHVHLILPGLLHAEKLSSGEVSSQLEGMLTRWGFTTVFDIASVLENTNLIRRRIESGEVQGPRLLTAGEPFWVRTPIYIRGFLEANHIAMPEIESKTQAEQRVRQQIHDGADVIKIFASSIERDDIFTMPLAMAQTIVAESHRAGKPVFAHVSNDQGIEVAVQSARTAVQPWRSSGPCVAVPPPCNKRVVSMLRTAPIHAYIPASNITRAREFYEKIVALQPRDTRLSLGKTDDTATTWLARASLL